MKYVCLVFSDERSLNVLPLQEMDYLRAACLAFDQELRASGQLLAAGALAPVGAATVVRVRNGRLGTTDGSRIGMPGDLSGFYLIEAKDLNDAIRIASRMPAARVGAVEVRPVTESTPFPEETCPT